MEDSAITLSGLLRSLGGPVSLVTYVGLIAVATLLVRGIRQRLRKDDTTRTHWWLLALSHAVLLTGALVYVVRLIGVWSDLIVSMNQTGRGDGLADALLPYAFQALPILAFPLGVALLASLASLAIGPPGGSRGPEPD